MQTVIKGINSTIFAYGQTGSGKTHTMFGPNWENSIRETYENSSEAQPPINQAEKHGIISRTIYKLFSESIEQENLSVYCSFMQIYNERLYDLLEDKDSKNPLVIRENQYNGVYVQGLMEHEVKSMEECLSLVFQGEKNRITRQTRLNMFSSRSHTIFQLLINNSKSDSEGKLKKAKLNLCDLAGSEKIGPEMEMTTKHFEELKNINLSLTTLGRVIYALSTKAPHVPYRDSKLTRILQDSIGGNTRTCLIATISPIMDCADESISTLSFANLASKVKIFATKNEILATDDTLVRKLQQELQYMKDLLQLKRKGGISDMNRQLLLLKQENEKLRSMHDANQLEQMKRENRAMKIELQKMRDQSFNNTGVTGWKSDVPSTNNISGDQNFHRSEQNFVTTLTAAQMTEKVVQQRRMERQEAANSLKRNIAKLGRCPICTLPIPCNHYTSVEEAITNEEKKSIERTPVINYKPSMNNSPYKHFNINVKQ